MPLTLPKQQITGNLGINNISGAVTLPMQSVTGTAQVTGISVLVTIPSQQVSGLVGTGDLYADISIPMAQVTGAVHSQSVSGTVSVPMQAVNGVMGMSGLFVDVPIPMAQVTGEMSATALDAAIPIPMQQIYGVIPEAIGLISIPMQEVVALFEQPILNIPMQQMAGSAVVPLVITDAPIAIPMQTFPVYQTGDIAGPAPLITGAATAMSGYWMAGDAPPMTGAATALTGSVASMSGRMSLPVSGIAVDAPSALDGVAPLVRSSVAALTGSVATVQSVADLVQSAIAATSGTAIAIASDAPLIAASSIAADSFATASLAGEPEPISSAMGASTGVALSIDSVMPSGAASAMQIWVRPEISMAGVAHVMRGSIQARAVAQAVKILAMNLKLGAVTEFQSEIEFEGVAALDGVVYVAGPDGVYAMTGAYDDGEAFAQSALFGMLDYGSSQKKHPDSVLIEASASAAPVVTVHVGSTSNAYTSVGPKRDGMYRAKVGRGLTGKRMQFEVSGTGIQSVSSVDVLVEPGKRAF